MGSETFTMPEPKAWLRNFTEPQPHAVTNLHYRSASDASNGVQYEPAFTADQLRAAVLETLERAEKICKERSDNLIAPGSTGYSQAKSWGAMDCVYAIRQLAEQVKALEFRRSGG